jgi:hypothetical protein
VPAGVEHCVDLAVPDPGVLRVVDHRDDQDAHLTDHFFFAAGLVKAA